jgi:hypothetical protein
LFKKNGLEQAREALKLGVGSIYSNVSSHEGRVLVAKTAGDKILRVQSKKASTLIARALNDPSLLAKVTTQIRLPKISEAISLFIKNSRIFSYEGMREVGAIAAY